MEPCTQDTPEQLFAKLAGATWFSRCDMKLAYAQLPVTAESADILTLNTMNGLYRVNRLAFGVAPAPAVFARVMKQELKDLEGVVSFLDDILIFGDSEDTLLVREEQVLARLSKLGFALNFDKCKFGLREIRYLGFKITGSGLFPLEDRVNALLKAPPPQDVSELKSFLGHLAFYDRFCQNRASVAAPLYDLLKKDRQWTWGPKESKAFQATKALLCSDKVLCFYSLSRPVAVACDSSDRGCGAVLYHILDEGALQPVMYVSKAFSDSQRKWSTFEKEFHAAVFAVTRLHEYLAGREFFLFTDHKPVVQFLLKSTPTITTPRILRGLLILGSYALKPIYRPGSQNCDADNLSRLIARGTPINALDEFDSSSSEVLQMLDYQENYVLALSNEPTDLPCSAAVVAQLTPQDTVLSSVADWCHNGWPEADPGGAFSPFFSRREAISVVRGCLLWGERVIVPEVLRPDVLKRLHMGHLGIRRTQALAELYVWYPGISKDIAQIVNECQLCQESRNALPLPAPGSWPTQRQWGRLHIDFAGPFLNKYICVLVDASTSWVDAMWCVGPTAEAAIHLARSSFSCFGLPDVVVSDNGPAFRSGEWQQYLTSLGVKVMFAAPYSPFQNGIVERKIQWLKSLLLKFKEGSLEKRLVNALAVMRLSPAADGPSPAFKLLGWQPDLPLAKIRPYGLCTPTATPAKFAVGDAVFYRVFPASRYGPKWAPGVIVEVEGENGKIYVVADLQGTHLRRAAPHVRGRAIPTSTCQSGDSFDTVGQEPIDTRDREVFSPYGGSRLQERRPRAPSIYDVPPQPAPRLRHRLRPAGMVSPNTSESEEDDAPPAAESVPWGVAAVEYSAAGNSTGCNRSVPRCEPSSTPSGSAP